MITKSKTKFETQPEPLADEALIWEGRPTRGITLRWWDLYAVPFSLVWSAVPYGLMTALILQALARSDLSFVFPMLPFLGVFILVGTHAAVGRFIYEWMWRGNMHYSVTNRRVYVTYKSWLRRKVESQALAALPMVNKNVNRSGCGSVTMNIPVEVFDPYGMLPRTFGFYHLRDAAEVHKLLSDLRAHFVPATPIKAKPIFEHPFEADLLDGERVLWVGRPTAWQVFEWYDLLYIPFSILAVGFSALVIPLWLVQLNIVLLSIFGELAYSFLLAFVVLFVLQMFHLLIGRFILSALVLHGTRYAISNKRVLLRQGRSLKTIPHHPAQKITAKISRRGDGTLVFGEPLSFPTGGFWNTRQMGNRYYNFPEIFRVSDADYVYSLLSEVQDALTTVPPRLPK